MPLIFNWNGDVIQNAQTEDSWSSKLGTFTSAKNTTTYFPLPLKYRTLVTSIGTFTVPPRFEKRPDLIARELYGSEDLWWLVFWMSGKLDPFAWPKTNDEVLVADISEVRALLN